MHEIEDLDGAVAERELASEAEVLEDAGDTEARKEKEMSEVEMNVKREDGRQSPVSRRARHGGSRANAGDRTAVVANVTSVIRGGMTG